MNKTEDVKKANLNAFRNTATVDGSVIKDSPEFPVPQELAQTSASVLKVTPPNANGRSAKRAGVSSLKLAEERRHCFSHICQVGTTVEDILDPGYFCNTIKKLKEGSKIEVTAEDMSFYAEFLVLNVASMTAKIHLLSKHDLAKTDRKTFENDVYRIEWMGLDSLFTVIRKADHSVIQTGFQSIIDAQKWLLDHEKAMSA